MYRLERNKKLVGVNVRRYLLNCHESNHPVSMAEIYDFCPLHKNGKRNEQARKILKEYAKYGVIKAVNENLYEILQPECILDDLKKNEAAYDIGSPTGFPPKPPMPLPIFGEKQVSGRLKMFREYLAKHIIYCHKNNYSIRSRDLRKYSDYKLQKQDHYTPSNLIKTMQSLLKAGALKRSHVPGYYTVEKIEILLNMLEPEDREIFREMKPKKTGMGRPRKSDDECTREEAAKRDKDHERYLANKARIDALYPQTPDWLVMTESVIMNMNGTARHTPEIDGRWREFCR